jgi:hypothetical protein
VARSFDVELTTCGIGASCAMTDLHALNHDLRIVAFTLLKRLSNDDLFKFERLPWPRGPKGAWVLGALDDWRYLCQWNQGVPSLWAQGLGRGVLTVERIKHKDYAAVLLLASP